MVIIWLMMVTMWLIYGFKRMVTMWLILMVIIWLMMVNNNLVGGAITPLKNMSSSMGRMTSHYGK